MRYLEPSSCYNIVRITLDLEVDIYAIGRCTSHQYQITTFIYRRHATHIWTMDQSIIALSFKSPHMKGCLFHIRLDKLVNLFCKKWYYSELWEKFRIFKGLINMKYYKLHKNGKFGNLLQLDHWIDTFPNFSIVFLLFFNYCACAFECTAIAMLDFSRPVQM